LNQNRLSSWKAIGELSTYALLELKVQHNPITAGDSPLVSPQVLRNTLIALMPTLLRLNSSEVPVKERTSAERFFLVIHKQEGHPVIKGLSEGCDVASHADRLRLVHGDVVGGGATEAAQAQRGALVNALVEVTLKPTGAAIVDRPPVKKRLPHTMTVSELKRLCESLFKQVPVHRVRLFLAEEGMPFCLPLDDDRELGFYGVCSGAEIRVADIADEQTAEKEVVKAVVKMRSSDDDDV